MTYMCPIQCVYTLTSALWPRDRHPPQILTGFIFFLVFVAVQRAHNLNLVLNPDCVGRHVARGRPRRSRWFHAHLIPASMISYRIYILPSKCNVALLVDTLKSRSQ